MKPILVSEETYQEIIDYRDKVQAKTYGEAVSIALRNLGEDHYRRHKEDMKKKTDETKAEKNLDDF